MRLASAALFSLVVAIAAASTGCATIMASGPDHIPIQTNPPGATVYVNGTPVGQTPMVVALDRNADVGNIQIALPGFQPVLIQRTKSINGWFWANLCWGILPMVVDAITGDIKRFDDTPIAIGLTPGGPGPQPGYPTGPQPGYPQGPQQGYPPGPPGGGGLDRLAPPSQPQPQPQNY